MFDGIFLNMPCALYLTNRAFFQMILNALETYPLETTGVLFGFRNKESENVDFEVVAAVPHVAPEARDENGVTESLSKLNLLKDLQSKLFGFVHLGGYHSHPEEDAEFSNEDKDYLQSKTLESI